MFEEKQPILIGYWVEQGEDNYIHPSLLVDDNWEYKDEVVKYLVESGEFYNGYFGWSWCRICGCENGAVELTDGTFYWPQGLVHYVRDHNVCLPNMFVDVAIKKKLLNIHDDYRGNYWERWCKMKKAIIEAESQNAYEISEHLTSEIDL